MCWTEPPKWCLLLLALLWFSGGSGVLSGAPEEGGAADARGRHRAEPPLPREWAGFELAAWAQHSGEIRAHLLSAERG